jgi:uncharacterized protein
MPDDLDALVAFLSRGEAYGLPGQPVEQITTHAAVVFLVGEHAYKMKRPVRYSFLDFSTVAKRRRALEAELRLNRRTAPMLYRRLIPVTRTAAAGYALQGTGQPVDWLLEMRRFDQAALLDRVAGRGELDGATIDALAEVIAGFHAQAEQRPERGGHAAMRQVIDGNAEDLAGLARTVFAASAVDDLNARTRSELERCCDLLEQRRRAGKVRHCHGDLHLGNIVLWDGRPVLFDCLEFDEALAAIDTFYDVAFTLMDLCHRGLRALAQRLLNGYLDATWDDAGLALLPLFLSCRAVIRAKVQGLAAEREDDAEARAREIEAARAYLDLAAGFLAPEPPRLVAIGGVSGTGKSTLARALAPALGAAPGAVLLRSDVVRKALCGARPTERLAPDAYDQRVSRRVYDTLAARATEILAAGQAAIVDAVFLDPEERARIEQVAAGRSVRFDGLWLTAPAEVLAQRLEARRGDASDATLAVLRDQLAADPGPIAWHTVDCGGAPETVAAAAAAALGM